MKNQQGKTTETEVRNSPIAWFYILEDARKRGDFERAAKAQKQLKRLGVHVSYKPSQQKKLQLADAILESHPTIIA